MTNYPPYQNFPTLSSSEIILRQVSENDANEIMEISYYNGLPAVCLDEAIAMQEKINEDYLHGNSIHWGIMDAQNSTLIGTCGYYRGFANQTGELGFEGRGFMTKALIQAIDFGQQIMGLQKIIAITEKDNIKSQNVLKRLNFLEERQKDNYITYTYQKELPV